MLWHFDCNHWVCCFCKLIPRTIEFVLDVRVLRSICVRPMFLRPNDRRNEHTGRNGVTPEIGVLIDPMSPRRGRMQLVCDVPFGVRCHTASSPTVPLARFRCSSRSGPSCRGLKFGRLRSGAEWIMHAKSGYTAYRVPVREAEDYFHVQHQASLTQVAERCG